MKNHVAEILSHCLVHHEVTEHKTGDIDIRSNWLLDQDFLGFHGHFPNFPILPAIFQLAMVRITAERAVHTTLEPLRYEKVKFKNMIKPGQKIALNLTLKRTPGQWSGRFKLLSMDEKTVASGKCFFVPKDHPIPT